MRSTCSFLFSPSSGRMWEYYGFSSPRGWRERREPEVWQIPPNHLVGTGQAAENQDVCLSKQLSPREFFSLFFISCSLASLRFKLLLRVNPVAAVHSFNHVWLFVTPWTAARQAPVCLCLPFLLLPSIFPSITSWQIDGKTVTNFILGGSKITSDGDFSHEIMGLDAMILVFWMLSFKPTFSVSSYLTYMQSTSPLCAYSTYMQNTSWEMLGWMKHKLESRLLGEISITSDMQMTPPPSLGGV